MKVSIKDPGFLAKLKMEQMKRKFSSLLFPLFGYSGSGTIPQIPLSISPEAMKDLKNWVQSDENSYKTICGRSEKKET